MMRNMSVAELWASLRSRHRGMVNIRLHFVGILMCVAAVAMAVMGDWLIGLCLLVAGCCLAVVGHLAEGTRSGTGILLGRLIGHIRKKCGSR